MCYIKNVPKSKTTMTKDQILDQFIENLKAANPQATDEQMTDYRAKFATWDIELLKKMAEIDFDK